MMFSFEYTLNAHLITSAQSRMPPGKDADGREHRRAFATEPRRLKELAYLFLGLIVSVLREDESLVQCGGLVEMPLWGCDRRRVCSERREELLFSV
jgi:hypothetical protein